MAAPYQLSDIYGKIKDLVKLWPIEDNKPSTFAVLTSFSDLDTPNLGKTIRDKDRPYFYSKAWADKMYNPSQVRWAVPAILMFEAEGTIAADASNIVKHTVQMAVLDSPESTSDTYVKLQTEDRTVHQIMEDTERVMIKVLTYLRTLDLGEWSRQYQALFLRDNPTLSFNRWSGGSRMLYGNVITLNFSIPCGTESMVLRTEKDEYQIQDHHKSEGTVAAPETLTDFGFDDLTGLGGGSFQPIPDSD